MALPRPLSIAWQLLRDTVSEFLADSAMARAATIAFYALLSLAPLLIVVIAIAGAAWGAEAARGEIVAQFGRLMGDDAAKTIEEVIRRASEHPQHGILATIFAALVLVSGAAGVFGHIKAALNTMWDVEPRPGRGVGGFIRDNVLSFAMVLCIGFLLLVSLAVSAGLAAMGGWIGRVIAMPPIVLAVINTIVSIGIITLLLAAMYRVLPDARVAWRDIWIGALATSAAFNLGKFLIGLYLGHSSTVSVYGAAGSLVLILLWVYYSSIIFLFGAEFTQVYAGWRGAEIVPSSNAQRAGCPRKAARPAQGRRDEHPVRGLHTTVRPAT